MINRPCNNLKLWEARWKRWRAEADATMWLAVRHPYPIRLWWWGLSYQDARQREMETIIRNQGIKGGKRWLKRQWSKP